MCCLVVFTSLKFNAQLSIIDVEICYKKIQLSVKCVAKVTSAIFSVALLLDQEGSELAHDLWSGIRSHVLSYFILFLFLTVFPRILCHLDEYYQHFNGIHALFQT